jgi:uncharacterized tellurite resistance protein B-like protein
MPILKDRADAILYLLDYMVGIDQHLDENESEQFVQSAFQLLHNDFERVQEKIRWIARLWREHDREVLFGEACDILRESDTQAEDLKMLQQMAAADGRIDPKEQELFAQICDKIGISPDQLSVGA